MTTISAYLRAERPDPTEPVSFYAPGVDDWSQVRALEAALATRSRAPREHLYPSIDEEDADADDPVVH